jgi:hypothetical protein
MRYTVTWLPSALDDLLSLWIEGPDRQAISDAANGIETILNNDPVLRGETLVGSLRILIADPLQIAYRIVEADRIVQIVGLRRALDVGDPD